MQHFCGPGNILIKEHVISKSLISVFRYAERRTVTIIPGSSLLSLVFNK